MFGFRKSLGCRFLPFTLADMFVNFRSTAFHRGSECSDASGISPSTY